MISWKFVFAFGLMAVSLGGVRAVSDEDKKKIHAQFVPYVIECSTELNITMEEIKEAKESDTLETFNTCFMGCVFKKATLINEKGLFDIDRAVELSKVYLSEEAEQKKVQETISKCKSINDKEVGDGEKGCERGVLLYECFKPYNEENIN